MLSMFYVFAIDLCKELKFVFTYNLPLIQPMEKELLK